MLDTHGHALQVDIETKECDIPEDQRARMQDGLERIGEAVQDFPESHLWLTVVFHPNSQAFHVQSKLRLPGHTIVTGGQSEHLDTAFERCLERTLKRVELYRRDPDETAIERASARNRLAAASIGQADRLFAGLNAAAERSDYLEFRHALRGHEDWLRLRVGRWVQRYPGVEDEIGRTLEISDLVEEVFLLAFERYADRPQPMPLRDWLDSLIDPAIHSFWRQPFEEKETLDRLQSARWASF